MKDYSHLGLNPQLRKANSLAGRRREWRTDLEQDAWMEKSPFGHPTQIHKGMLEITGGGTLVIKDATGGTTTFTIDPTSGSITQVGNLGLTGDAAISGALTVGGTTITGAYSKGEIGYVIAQQERQWTESATYVDINASKFKLNGDSFALTNVYFEVLGAVEVEGKTAYYRIYNITDEAAITESEITTTNVGTANAWANAEVIRSGTIPIPSGVKEYKMQFKHSSGGGEGTTAQLMKAQLIFVST